MTRLIDADAIDTRYVPIAPVIDGDDVHYELVAFVEDINEQPTIDAEPVKHGKWIIWDETIAGIYHTVSECSECGFTTDKMSREEMPYCPNCGARMDEE